MATNLENLTVKVSVDGKDASDAFKDINKEAQKLTSSFGSMATGVIALNQAFELASKAVSVVTQTFGGLVKEFAAAEQAQFKLEKALSLAGNRILNTAKQWDEYAETIEKATGEDADSIKQLVARSVQIGRSEEQTKNLIDASKQLSFVTGGSLADAFSMLENTYKGVTRGVDVYDRSIKSLTQEQLQNGQAVDAILKKYKDLKQVESTALSIKLFSIALDDLREEIGAGIVEATNLNENLNSLKNIVADVTRVLKVLDFKELTKSIAGFSAVLTTVAFVAMPAFRAQILLVASSAGGMIAAFAPMAAVATAVIGAGIAVELLARNISKLPKLVDLFWNSFKEAIFRINAALHKLNITIADILGLEGQKEKSIAALQEINTAISSYSKKAEDAASELDLGFTGEIAGQAKRAWDALTGSFIKSGEQLKKVGKEAIADTVADPEMLKQIQEQAKKASDAFFGMLDSVKKLQDVGSQLQFNLSMPDATEAERTYQAGLLQVQVEKEKAILGGVSLRQADELAAKMVNQLETNKQLQEGAKIVADIMAEQKKNVEDTNAAMAKLNEDNQNAISNLNKFGMSYQQIIQQELDLELSKIDALEEQLRLKSAIGEITPEQRGQLDTARALATQGAEQKQMQPFVDMFSGLGDIGKTLGADIAMQIGGEMAMQIAQMANMITLALKAPELIRGVADFIGSITDFPKALLDALVKLLSELDRFIIGFVDSLIENIPKIISAILSLVTVQIPRVVRELIAAVPAIIAALIDSIPQIVLLFVEQFVLAGPKFSIAITLGLIKGIPLIVKALIKQIPTLIPEILKGLRDSVFSLFSDLGTSVGTGITNGIKAATQSVTGIGSQLFGLVDALPGGASDQANEILDNIHAAGQEAYSWLVKAWEWLKSIWKDYIFPVFDVLIIKPLKFVWEVALAAFNLAIDGFKFVWDIGVIAFNAVVETFKAVWEFGVSLFKSTIDVFKLVFDGVVAAFETVWNLGKAIFEAIIGTFRAVWEFAKGVFTDPIAAFKGLISDLGSVFSQLGNSIANAFKPIQDFFGSFFNRAGEIGASILGAASDLGKRIGEIFSKAFKSVVDLFKTPINKFIDILNGIKIPAVDYSVSNRFFSVSGNLIPEVDLIPGTIQRLNQGGPVGGFGFTDNQPALLTPGEFVMNRNAVRDIGMGTLERMNRGMMPQGNTANVSVNLTVNTEQPIDERYIKTRLVPVLLEEVKRESLRGAFVLSGRGIK